MDSITATSHRRIIHISASKSSSRPNDSKRHESPRTALLRQRYHTHSPPTSASAVKRRLHGASKLGSACTAASPTTLPSTKKSQQRFASFKDLFFSSQVADDEHFSDEDREEEIEISGKILNLRNTPSTPTGKGKNRGKYPTITTLPHTKHMHPKALSKPSCTPPLPPDEKIFLPTRLEIMDLSIDIMEHREKLQCMELETQLLRTSIEGWEREMREAEEMLESGEEKEKEKESSVRLEDVRKPCEKTSRGVCSLFRWSPRGAS